MAKPCSHSELGLQYARSMHTFNPESERPKKAGRGFQTSSAPLTALHVGEEQLESVA